MSIGPKYQFSISLIFSNRYLYQPWKSHIIRPLIETLLSITQYISTAPQMTAKMIIQFNQHLWNSFNKKNINKLTFMKKGLG